MDLLVAFHDVDVLLAARGSAMAGRFPHLRLVPLVGPEALAAVWDDVPAHVRVRLVDATPELMASGAVEAMLTTDRARTAAAFPEAAPEDTLTWDELPALYERWLDTTYLPFNREHVFTPDGLFPLGWDPGAVTLELIGSCGAVHLLWAVEEAAAPLGVAVTSIHTVQNHPGEQPAAMDDDLTPDVRVVVPPLRYMHPATLDDFVAHLDHERLFAETLRHLHAYLESVFSAHPTAPLFVAGFIEPYMNPQGSFFPARSLSNYKHFVRCLNDAVVDWCEQRPLTHFVDADEIAAAVGKAGVDEGALYYYSHRGPLDEQYDDAVDYGYPTVTVKRSYDVRTRAFSAGVIREVLHRLVTLGGRARVKAVIFDLDNTLWRGLASDGVIGSFNGRPQGLIEAIKILKRRGVFVAIASKNDEAYVREHWDEILGAWAELPLGTPLSLDDFDAVRIDFRPKSVTIAEILAQLNILPDSAVFVDDNPLEREEVQAAFPDLRVLGAELNYVRRELVHSPFTQAPTRTAEDGLRAESAKQQVRLQEHLQSGTATNFLESLGLRCTVGELYDPEAPATRRAVQLINKTNQWNLNGERVTDAEARAALEAGARLLVADVRDAHTHHGIVGAALVDPTRGVVTHLVVSCRVIGMGVDDAFAHALLQAFGPLALAYRDSDRNRAAAATLMRWTGTAPEDGPVPVAAVPAPAHVALVRGAEPEPAAAR